MLWFILWEYWGIYRLWERGRGKGDTRVILAVQVAFSSGAAERSVVLVDYQTVVVVLVVAQTLWSRVASVHLR